MSVPLGFVRLILSPEDEFYLEIPIHIITTLCLNAHKYLQYIGWCVLGVIGDLTDEKGSQVFMDGQLIDQGIYMYIVYGDDIFRHVIDPEVLKKEKTEFSESTDSETRVFTTRLLERDGYCVWTGLNYSDGMHIIPPHQGTDWLRLILNNRPPDPSLLRELDHDIDIDDIQNGITASSAIHRPFDQQMLGTPNHILTCEDIPARHQRQIQQGLSFQDHSRYTLQWLVPAGEIVLNTIPNNNDATFLDQGLPKPADMLLHYMYGAAAVKNWGKNTEILSTHYDKIRPPKQNITRRKRNREGDGDRDGREEGGAHENVGETNQTQKKWDEHDVMLFFWSNTKAARERRERQAKAEDERKDSLEKWRLDIPS